MGQFSSFLSGVLVVTAASTVLATTEVAQAIPPETTFNPVADDFNRAASRSSGDSFKIQSIFGQGSTFLGISFPWPSGSIGAFPEQALAADTRDLIKLYREAFLKQYSSDPVIRVVDHPNPYNTSILTQPSYGELNQSQPAPFNGF